MGSEQLICSSFCNFICRSALAFFRLPPSSVAVVSLSQSNSVCTFGRAMGCYCMQLNPIQPSKVTVACALHHVAAHIKQQTGALCVGYAMKPSRAQTLAQQGMLPFTPLDGVFFVPVDVTVAPQIPEGLFKIIDVFLHKATDYLDHGGGSGAVPSFSATLLQTLETLESNGIACIVDPLSRISWVLDRSAMGAQLDEACKAARKLALPVRSPAWNLVHTFPEDAARRLGSSAGAAGPALPWVVKPQVACGPAEAHQMAFVLHQDGLRGLDVPLPAVIQEYVDHGGIIWKVYVAGSTVFSTRKRSSPNLAPLRQLLLEMEGEGDIEDAEIPTAIEFNSLESLPVSLPWLPSDPGAPDSGAERSGGLMRPEFFEALAGVLQRHMGLTLFGFDVVFDAVDGEAVVVDVNFFPSFKSVEEAPGALRAALKERWQQSQGHAAGDHVA